MLLRCNPPHLLMGAVKTDGELHNWYWNHVCGVISLARIDLIRLL